METTGGSIRVSDIVRDIDRLINEMTALRSRISELEHAPLAQVRSVREEDFFGMWADRVDMSGKTSREWVNQERRSQWTRQ